MVSWTNTMKKIILTTLLINYFIALSNFASTFINFFYCTKQIWDNFSLLNWCNDKESAQKSNIYFYAVSCL